MDVDRFGVAMLHPSVGRVWVSEWDNAHPRAFTGRARDPYDPQCEIRGTGPEVWIDGYGVARAGGAEPRLYVNDPNGAEKWLNVEVTVYARRGCERPPDSVHQGFIVGARSEHQDADRCKGTGYYGRLMYTGAANFKKELGHLCYTPARPNNTAAAGWGCGIPAGVWVGMKFVVRNTAAGVRLELYRDLTGGAAGGTWEKLAETVDAGDWATPADNRACDCHPPATVLTAAATSVFLRNTTAVADYRWFTVREVAANT